MPIDLQLHGDDPHVLAAYMVMTRTFVSCVGLTFVCLTFACLTFVCLTFVGLTSVCLTFACLSFVCLYLSKSTGTSPLHRDLAYMPIDYS